MANKVIQKNEIYLNGTYYPLNKPVQSTLASIYPAKVVIGDTTKDSQLRSSVVSWSDWRGGIGVERMQGPADADRAWFSTCQTRYRHHLVLGALGNVTTAEITGGSTAITGEITMIQDLGSTTSDIYASWDLALYNYVKASDDWTRVTASDGGSAYSFPSTPTDSISVRMDGTDYIVVAHRNTGTGASGYSYFSSAIAVTNKTNSATTSLANYGNAIPTEFLTFWDERLWGISSTGQLWYTLTIGGDPVADAKLPVPDDYVTDLFVGRDSQGEQIIYASTQVGLYAHDAANQRFVETQFHLPFHQFNGSGSVRWRDSIYSPSGLGIYKYINGNIHAVITVMGPDRDDGLPQDRRGTIKKLAGTHTELLAAVDATTAPESVASTDMAYQWSRQPHFGSSVIDSDSGYSTILGWNDTGWECKWQAPDPGKAIEHMIVTNAGQGDYRMWWGYDGNIYHQMVPFDIINPAQLGNYEYAVSGTHETPWFDAQQTEVDKTALKLKIETSGCSSNETVKAYYYADYSTTEVLLGTITSNGVTTYTFNDDDESSDTYGDPIGKTFRAIKIKLDLARENDADAKKKSPDVISVTLEYRKKLEAKWGHAVEVDLNREYKGNSSKELRANLVSAIESDTLVEFTYRDDDSTTRNYFVDVTSATGIEYTGHDERGSSRITLVEP